MEILTEIKNRTIILTTDKHVCRLEGIWPSKGGMSIWKTQIVLKSRHFYQIQPILSPPDYSQ